MFSVAALYKAATMANALFEKAWQDKQHQHCLNTEQSTK